MSASTTGRGVIAFLGTAAVVAAVLAALGGLGLGNVAGKYLPELPPECPSSAVVVAPLDGLAVSIHNSIGVEGLAATTAEALKATGIRVVSLGNAPTPAGAVAGAEAVITSAAQNLPAAAALQSLFPKSVFVVDEEQDGTGLYLTSSKPTLVQTSAAGTTTLRCQLEK